MEALSQQIVKDAQALINFFQLQNDMKSLFPELQKYKGFSKEEIIESSIKKYGKSLINLKRHNRVWEMMKLYKWLSNYEVRQIKSFERRM